MSKIHFERFDNLLKFLPKSKIKAGDGQNSGKYPFFKSGNDQSKFIDTAVFEGESLIIGDGGSANINFYDKKFSASNHCYVIQKDSQNIDVKYVYYYLKLNLQILEAGFKGAGLKNISKKYISEIKIPLLSLQDQQKITGFLSQIEELIKKREESINLLEELTKSTFLEMFFSSQDKKLFPLGNYINFMTSGSRGWAQYYSETGAIFLRIQNVNNGKLLLDDIIRVNLPNKTEGTRTRVQESDLLMSITADLGRTAVIPKNFEEAYINQHLALLRLKLDLINPIYLSHYFCTDFAKLQVQKYNKGGAKAGLNFIDIKKINILIPSKPLQDKFAEIVTQIEQTKTIYQNSLNGLNNLFCSIAQKAFKGELDVSNIERIQKEKRVFLNSEVNTTEQNEISSIEFKLDTKKITDIKEEEILKLLAEKSLTLNGLVNKWNELNSKEKHYKEDHFEILKERIFEMIEDEKIKQSFEFTEVLLRINK